MLIVGEGQETEPNYFHRLKLEDVVSARFTVTVKPGPGFSPERVVEKAMNEAKRRGKDYDEVWCVLDVEGPQNRESLNKAREMASKEGIKLCLSNPCFEVWFLTHFERKGRSYRDCDEVVVCLNMRWQKHFGQDYQKNDDAVYRRLREWREKAVENAKWVLETHHQDTLDAADCNSSTEVYRLVAYLTGSPE